jgi:septin family protein
MSRSGRVGLSEFTAQRLAELRARRAEAEASDGYSSSLGAPPNPPIGVSSSTIDSSSDSICSSSNTSSPAKLSSEFSSPAKFSTNSVEASDLKESKVTSQSTSRLPVQQDASIGISSVRSSQQSSSSFKSSSTANISTVGGGSSGPPQPPPKESLSARLNDSSQNGIKYMDQSSSRLNEDEDERLGFASLPEQIHRKAIKRGFDFTLMVVGESGLGKSTLITSMFFNHELYNDRTANGVEDRLNKTIKLEKRYLEIEERSVKLRLTIVDTPGFNDSIDSSQCWKPIEDYIHQQFQQYLKDESGLNRRNIKDNRVHCCLYFISPYGRGLRQIDIQFMLRLHNKVNIVPVIAKADMLTPSELKLLKSKVLEEIEKHKIRIYELPQCDSDEEEEFKKKDLELKNSIPFAVIGSNTIVEVNGKKVKGRIYPWGIAEVENPTHSDFAKLRQFLVSTHMQDLKDVTKDIHYENFRASSIKDEQARGEHRSIRESTSRSASDADYLLRQKEEEIKRMQEMLKKMQSQLAVSKGESNNMTKIL